MATFQPGDIIAHKDNPATTYTVVAVTTAAIVYARHISGNYVRAMLTADMVLVTPVQEQKHAR